MNTLRHTVFHSLRIALSVLCVFSSQASAHHATALEYDISRTVTLKGKVIRVDWANPHIHVYVEVKPAQGAPQEWDVEFPSPGGTIVAGLSREALANGVMLTFEGYVSKPDFRPNPRKNSTLEPPLQVAAHFACATGITLSNGHQFNFVVGI
jgi:hypothetical protein